MNISVVQCSCFVNLVNDFFPLILENLHSIPRKDIEYAFISEEYNHPSANEVDQKCQKILISQFYSIKVTVINKFF